MMSPEERALTVWFALDQPLVSTGTAEGIIADAIRAAENDALERAALACEALQAETIPAAIQTRHACRVCAEEVRALKHVYHSAHPSDYVARIEQLETLLEWLHRKGGLGLDVHARIEKTLARNSRICALQQSAVSGESGENG
jgi:hypothetical protein